MRACLLACLLAGLAGCEALQLAQPLGSPPPAAPPAPPLAVAWRYDAEGAFGPASAFQAGGMLILGTRRGDVHILNELGRRVGRVQLGASIEGAPVLVEGQLLVVPLAGGRDGVVAYDLVDGARRWRALPRVPHTAGLQHVDGVIVAPSLDGAVRGLDAQSGVVRWTYDPDPRAAYHAAAAVLPGGVVAVADDRGRVTALDVQTGAAVWMVSVGAPVYAAPAASAGRLFVPTTRGVLAALDAATGEPVWAFRATEGVRFAAPSVTTDAVYVGASDGRLLRLDPASGELRWAFVSDGHVAAAPLVAGGAVYAGTLDERLVVLDAATGALRWERELGGRVKSSPVAFGSLVVALAEPRRVWAFRAEDTVAPSGPETASGSSH